MSEENRRQKIAVVDDNITNLSICRSVLKPYYDVHVLPSARELFAFLERFIPDLILLDIEMPEMNGYEAMRKLREDFRFSEISVIFLTSKRDEGSELEGLTLGAIDYIFKPFSAPLLLKRIENHLLIQRQGKLLATYNEQLVDMVNEKTTKLMALQNAITDVIAELVEFRDSNTGGHIWRTQQYLQCLIEKMQESGVYRQEVLAWDLEHLIPAAKLHDVGKISISDAILNKPGKLTPEEFAVMQTHASLGMEIIDRIEREAKDNSLEYARIFAGYHHEKWDGTGYPHGLGGERIPLLGRLMAIADVYDALISARPYKEPMPLEKAREIMQNGRGVHFDPLLIDVFSSISGDFEAIAQENRRTKRSLLS
ncbi:MAG: response regulator [Zoogloeaceae bacterium]|jgi:putative two-component system response regulator|nr:response regulator [Zoogloeaceae bacterium]